MKKVIMVYMVLVALTGCKPGSDDNNLHTGSIIIARAADPETTNGPVLFTGDDILWFNESTGELRFRNNISNKGSISDVVPQGIKLYLGEEYLFYALAYVGPWNSRVVNSLVFLYNATDNRYFFMDGYPETALFSDPQIHETRDKNMKAIEPQWRAFIEQLRKEGLYRSN